MVDLNFALFSLFYCHSIIYMKYFLICLYSFSLDEEFYTPLSCTVSWRHSSQNSSKERHRIRPDFLEIHFTLFVQNFRKQKNQPLPIYRSRPSRDSQKPKTTKIFQFSRWLFQKIPFLYFFLHKSWIWQTLGHVMNIFFFLAFS